MLSSSSPRQFFFKDLEYLPTPVLVGLVAGEVVEVEKALHGLRPQEVVGIVWLHVEVLVMDTNFVTLEQGDNHHHV